MIRLINIQEAQKRLDGIVIKTPFVSSFSLSEITGSKIYLKLESLQRTGSFKIRGAYNKLSQISEKNISVIAASAGNHAQGVALAAKLLGIKSRVVMPENTAVNKMLTVKELGSEIILEGNSFDEAYKYARKLELESGDTFVHPYDDPDIISGQGTVGLEIVEDLKVIDVIFVPVGGGGLISGVAIALKEINPEIKVIGVESINSASLSISLKSGRITETEDKRTIADGIAVKRIGELNFEIAKKYVDDVILVTEDEIEEALMVLAKKKRLVVEGSGAVGLAALLKIENQYKDKNVVLLISGGNIDINLLSKIIERSLIKTGRLMKLKIELPDTPGVLGRLTSLLGEHRAHIVQVMHDRLRSGLPLDIAFVEITVETRSFEHQKEILDSLKASGYVTVGD